MHRTCRISALFALTGLFGGGAAPPQGLVTREIPTGVVVGYQDTPLQPWVGNKYHVHDPDRPFPPPVTPSPAVTPPTAMAPSDGLVLFDGHQLDQWQPNSWEIADGCVTAGAHESLQTRESFGDCQLHIEWATPTEPSENFMNRGNSGVLLMGKYELQIFDSWVGHRQQIYPDGQAAAIYGQTPPLVNACREPGRWQTFDIIFQAPWFENDKLVRAATITVLHNGVLVHNHQVIHGPMSHREILPYQPHAARLPLVLQGHGSPVRFRNIWIRPLDRS